MVEVIVLVEVGRCEDMCPPDTQRRKKKEKKKKKERFSADAEPAGEKRSDWERGPNDTGRLVVPQQQRGSGGCLLAVSLR